MKKIKIGIITNENWVDKYTYNLAKWIKLNNKKFEFSSYISVEKKQKKIINNKIFKKIFFRIILIIENFLLKSNKNHHDHLKKFNLEKILKKKILIKIDNNNRLKFNKSDIKKAKKERFDILIRSCSNILSNEFIKISKNGVISFHHGDYEKFRGAPAGFWEVFFKEMKSGFMIQKINENLDYGNIILKGYFQTKAYFLLNQAELYQKSNYYLKKVILDFYNKRKFYFQKKNKKGKVYETPKIMNQIRYLLKTFIFLIKKKIF